MKTIRDFYKKDFDLADIRTSIIAAISIKVQEPMFESQTKTKLGSKDIAPEGPSVRNFIFDFVTKSWIITCTGIRTRQSYCCVRLSRRKRSGKRCPVSRRSQENEPSR